MDESTVQTETDDPTGVRCLACGYRLWKLPSATCPECGRAFDADDPWTVWLPNRPNRLARWLMHRPTILGRSFPLLAVLAVAWGTRIPGLDSPALIVGAILFGGCVLGGLAWLLSLRFIHRRGYPDRGEAKHLRWFVRNCVLTLAIAGLLLLFRPALYASFWISYPWLNETARQIDAQPFQIPAPSVDRQRGLYRVSYARRCPHGVKLKVIDDGAFTDAGPGFFLCTHPGECSRFKLARPLGRGWYASD